MLKDYTTMELKLKNPDEENNKTEISNDAYAICEFIDKLIRKIK